VKVGSCGLFSCGKGRVYEEPGSRIQGAVTPGLDVPSDTELREGATDASERRVWPSESAQMRSASLTAFTGLAFTISRAGFAWDTVGSLVNGLMPLRALVAGFLTTTNFANPGTRNTPPFSSSLCPTVTSASRMDFT